MLQLHVHVNFDLERNTFEMNYSLQNSIITRMAKQYTYGSFRWVRVK